MVIIIIFFFWKRNTEPLIEVPVKCTFFLKRTVILFPDRKYMLELQKKYKHFAVKSCSFAKTKMFPWNYSNFWPTLLYIHTWGAKESGLSTYQEALVSKDFNGSGLSCRVWSQRDYLSIVSTEGNSSSD